MERTSIVFLAALSFVILGVAVGSSIFAKAPVGLSYPETGVLTDPSGIYVFYNMTDTQNPNGTITSVFYMNLTSYQQLMHDPYSTHPQGEVQIVGNVVRVTSLGTSRIDTHALP
jgi:hypothetical protein